MHVFVKASVALFLAAEVLIVAVVGGDGLWLVGAWAIVAGGVTDAVELGLFFVPAAGVLLAAAVAEHDRGILPHKTPLHAGR